jgi:hypothetical protein
MVYVGALQGADGGGVGGGGVGGAQQAPYGGQQQGPLPPPH